VFRKIYSKNILKRRIQKLFLKGIKESFRRMMECRETVVVVQEEAPKSK